MFIMAYSKSNVPNRALPNIVLPTTVQPRKNEPYVAAPFKPNYNLPNTANKNNLFVADYNDPTQINSIVDVFFAKNKLNATAELFKNSVNPLTHKDEQGRWDPQLGVFMLKNNLIHAGEIMDVLANPVKALLIGLPTGDSISNLKKAVNWDGKGRYNFDYDLAPGRYVDGIFNFALEMVSDPVNLATWGLSGALKSAGKKGMTQTGKLATKQITKEAVQNSFEVAGRKVTEEVVEQIAQESIEIAVERTAIDFAQDGSIKSILKDKKRLSCMHRNLDRI